MTYHDSIQKTLGFPEWIEATGRRSVADLYRPKQRCGIYILGFATGEQYVGQAVDVVRRFTQHCKTHNDIIRITFQRIGKNDLDRVERHCIHEMQAAGVLLRNFAHMSVVQGERDLDLVVSPQEQQDWYDGTKELYDKESHVQDDALRSRHRFKFQKFMSLQHAEEALYLLGLYIQNVILFPRYTEMTFWSVSCLPYGVNLDTTLYLRVNINMQEVFALWGSLNGLEASFHMAHSPFQEELGEDWKDKLLAEGWVLTDNLYAPGGEDQFNLIAFGDEQIIGLIDDPSANRAMALMNWRLMRKGPTFYSKSHCMDLVDAAIEQYESFFFDNQKDRT